MDKVILRNAMKSLLGKISPDERHTRSLAACNIFSETREFHDATLIMLFLSMENEVETTTLAIQAWKSAKSIAVPRVYWEQRVIEPVEINSLDSQSNRGSASLREPAQGRVIPLGMIDLVVVPGLAYDRRGFRVGRGKGFYDRFLAQKELHGLRVALCFHEQVLSENIPVEPHDVPMHLIITDREVIRCARPLAAKQTN